ncbi:hypothetical protein, partial [Hydrogenophaga sp.]|uniref:hypothetical protein n=1 Tax=Hydrogenophaga sp. TaxID=1904254 RepID=UPI0016AF999B
SPAADEADEAARGKLVERLGCLPLALDVAAQRMVERGWSAVEYVARLENVPSLVAELNLPLADR